VDPISDAADAFNRHTCFFCVISGFPPQTFPCTRVFAGSLFHALDIAAGWCLVGSRLFSVEALPTGAQAVPVLALDFLTMNSPIRDFGAGLALTVSQKWLRGEFSTVFSQLARDHRDRRAALSPVWKVFPFLAVSASRREVL